MSPHLVEPAAPVPVDIPSSELLRLADLATYRTPLDAPDDDLSELARLVATLTNSPIAGISLIDEEHVWLKARVGVDANCLVREGSFCNYAIQSHADIFRIPDTRLDPRFVDNSLVAGETQIRMYSSAILRSVAGYPIGTLWIMDRVPRELSDVERNSLLALGSHAAHLLQKRRRHPVSGLATREAFVSHLECALSRSAAVDDLCRNADCPHMKADGRCRSGLVSPPVTVGFVALQNLAQLRAAYGESAGRELVVRLGSMIEACVGNGNLVVHLEADNFGFAILGDPGEARRTLAQLEALLARPIDVGGEPIQLACSIGVNIAQHPPALASAMLDQAAWAASAAPR